MRYLTGIVLFLGAGFAVCDSAQAASFSITADTNFCSGSSTISCSFNGLNAGGAITSDSLPVTNLTANSLQLQVTASTTNGGNWLSASVSPNPIAGGKTGTLTITVNPKLLPPLPNNGSYKGTVTLSGGGTTVTIFVSVTTGGLALALSPDSVALTLTTGEIANQPIRIVNPNNNSTLSGVGANIQSNQSWCTVSGFDGSSFKVTIDATALPPGPANATVTVQYNGNGSSFVTVSLAVSATVMPPATPVASPSALSFSASQGGPNPAPQAVSITTSDGSTQGFTVTAMPSFASVSPGSGAASGNPTTITVTVNTSALRAGANSGTITLTLVHGGATDISVSATLGAPGTGGQLFPHFADGGEWQTDFLLINPTAAAVSVELKFHIDGETTVINLKGLGNVSDLKDISIPPQGSVSYRSAGSPSSPLISGWVEVISPVTLNGAALFRRHPSNGKYYEGSIPLTAPSSRFTIPFDGSTFPATGDVTYTALAIVNPSATGTANVTCSAYDISGVLLGANLQIASLGVMTHTAFTLQTSAPENSAIGNRRGVLICNSTGSVGVLGLRAFGVAAISSLPVITSPMTSASQVFPHFADGGEWQTEFLLVNLNSSTLNVTIKFHPDGSTATLNVQGVGNVPAITNISIPPNGSAFYRTAGDSSSPLISGWAEIVSTLPLNGVALFRRHPGDGKYYEGSIPLASPSQSFTIPYDGSTFSNTGDTTYTGLALVNPSTSSSVAETCSAYDKNGNVLGASLQIASLSPLSHTAFILQTAPPENQAVGSGIGILVCNSSFPTAVLGLRALGVFTISSLPVTGN